MTVGQYIGQYSNNKKQKAVPMLMIESELIAGVMDLIRAAEHSVEASLFEWSWYPGQRQGTVQGIARELGRAAQRGVKVRILLHNESMRGHLGKINRRTGGELKRLGCDVKMGGTAKVLHAKYWIIDRKKIVVGSHNLSIRSTKSNSEVSMASDAPDDVSRLSEYFEDMWARWGR